MKREQILWGLQYKYLFWPARAKLTIFAADCVLTFHVSRPRQLNEGASSLRLSCVSSTDCPYCYAVLNGDGRVHTVTCVRLFYLFLTYVFTPFHICASLFSPSFFSSHFYFIPIFTRTFFIVFNFNLPRASLDATISLCVSAFNRLNPRATSGFFQLMYLLTLPPGVNVIMPDLSTLGWCHCEKAEHESYDWTLQTLRAEPRKP